MINTNTNTVNSDTNLQTRVTRLEVGIEDMQRSKYVPQWVFGTFITILIVVLGSAFGVLFSKIDSIDIKDDVHEIRLDVAVIKEQLKHFEAVE